LYFLEKSSFTKQRLKLYPIQRDELLCNQFAIDVSLYSKEMLVFETGGTLLGKKGIVLEESQQKFKS